MSIKEVANEPHLANKIAEAVGRVLGHPKVKIENPDHENDWEGTAPEKSHKPVAAPPLPLYRRQGTNRSWRIFHARRYTNLSVDAR